MNKILYVQYTNPAGYPPLEHSSRILADAGWEVRFLGTGAVGANDLRISSHGRIHVRQLPFCPAGWRQKLHYLWFAGWVLGWVIRWRPQWVYASDQLSSPVCLLVTFLPGVRLIYHEHDSPAHPGHSKLARLYYWARGSLARRAALCILPNQNRLLQFSRDTGPKGRVQCVWNCPARSEVGPPRQSLDVGKLWVLFHGSIVPSRLPPTVIEAFALLPSSVHLRVIGYSTVGHPAYVEDLKKLSVRLGVSNRVDFIGTVPFRSDLMEQCRQCDVGIAFMPFKPGDLNEEYMLGASNKPFDYLAGGLGLLVSDLPDWREFYVSSGYGIACNPDDPSSIASALRWFLEHPAELRAMGERGRQQILVEWNYETQFAPVLDLLQDGKG